MGTLERFPRRAGVARVVARDQLTPRMLRLTLQCDDFGPGWPIEQPGEIITLLFVPAGEGIVLPEMGWRFPEGAPEQAWRNYTVRAHRAPAREIDVDVVLHEPRGPACTWAAAAAIGDDVGYAGPRVDYAPADARDWLLLAGDETALPAIAAILESVPADLPVTAVVEIADAAERLNVVLGQAQELVWVERGGAPAATTSHLADALRAVPAREGNGQAWGAGESKIARDLRTVLREERGMPKARAHARGYWLRKGEWILDD